MAEGLFDPGELTLPGIAADTLRAAVVRVLPRTPLHLDLAPDRETAGRLARNELQADGCEHWFRYFTEADIARCDDPQFALAMVNHEFCQVVRSGERFIVTDVDGSAGSSGSPLIDARGRVIGLFSRALGDGSRNGTAYTGLQRVHVPTAMVVESLGLDVSASG